ncbi:MAG: alpha/beta hydrolase-fold protein [Chloroflexota bacterium]
MIARLSYALTAGLMLAMSLVPTSLAAPAHDSDRTSTTPASVDVNAPNAVVAYAGGSTVFEPPLYSRVLDLHTSYRVMVPAGYFTSTDRYPVLYMLHGVAGDTTEWQSIGLLEAADRLVQRGEIDPFIIVLPNGGANYWVNQATGARWADYVVQDVVAQVDRDYRTIAAPQARAIGGLSMGGEGAMRLALQHPDVFGTAAAHSPSLRTAFDQFAPELQTLFGDEAYWREQTPFWLVLDSDAAYRVNLEVDVGEDDPWRPNVELLHQRMLSRRITHTFEVLPGEHAAEYWIGNVDRYLQFYSSALAPNAVIPVNSDD